MYEYEHFNKDVEPNNTPIADVVCYGIILISFVFVTANIVRLFL